jgi:hypothetical protein
MQPKVATVYAGDSATLTVSCVIPAILGVNAPLIEGQTVERNIPTSTNEQIQPPQQNTQEPIPTIVQEDIRITAKSGQEADGQIVLVRTFYSR